MLSILVLGPGCYNCHKLEAMCKEVVGEHDIEAAVAPITDLDQIHALGVMMTPGLVVDGEVKTVGKVAPVEAIKAILA